MELGDYIRILRKRWWIIVVAVVLTAGSGFVFSKLQHPEYTSTAEIIIEPARPDWGLAQSTKMVLRTYMTVIDSDRKALEVINELKLPMTPDRLRSKARFAAEDDRMVIKIEIEDYDEVNGDLVAWVEVPSLSGSVDNESGSEPATTADITGTSSTAALNRADPRARPVTALPPSAPLSLPGSATTPPSRASVTATAR